jgi:hypothetical protein
MKHKKPTKEELETKVQEAIEESEKAPEETPEETPEEKKTPIVFPKEAKEEVVEEIPEEVKEEVEPTKEELEEEVAKKDKKLSASARENQKIYAKNRVINKALVEAEEVPEPGEEELRKEFTDWDVMSDTEKVFAKETVVSRKWRETISKAKEQAEKIEKWNESVAEFVDNPETLNENPDLEGKTEEFKEFATQEANNSVPMKILVSAFLHEHSTAKKLNKGKMFERGLGGSNEKPQPKSDKITIEEARILRNNDYNKWKEYLMAGKIESDL